MSSIVIDSVRTVCHSAACLNSSTATAIEHASTTVSVSSSPKLRKLLLLFILIPLSLRYAVNVCPPKIVRHLDLVDLFWSSESEKVVNISPEHVDLKPCVDLYCLISMANSFTDFHVDMSGSSLWYHIVKVTTTVEQQQQQQ